MDNRERQIRIWLLWGLRRQRTHLQCRRPRFSPWVGKIPWRREWQPTPLFLPGESHGQRSVTPGVWFCPLLAFSKVQTNTRQRDEVGLSPRETSSEL